MKKGPGAMYLMRFQEDVDERKSNLCLRGLFCRAVKIWVYHVHIRHACVSAVFFFFFFFFYPPQRQNALILTENHSPFHRTLATEKGSRFQKSFSVI